MAVPGRKSKRRARTVNRPGPKISATCVSVCPRAFTSMPSSTTCFSKQSHVSRRIHDSSERQPSPSAQTLDGSSMSKDKHPFRFAAHQQIASCLFSHKVSANRARPISSPVIASSTRARHAAVCGLAVVFRRAAASRASTSVAVSSQLDVLSQVSPPCRTIDWISAVGQIISFGNRFCRNHGRYRCRIQVSGDPLPGHTHELVKEFHIRSFFQWSPSQTSSSHDTKHSANVEFRAPLNDPEEQSIAPTFRETTCSLANRR